MTSLPPWDPDAYDRRILAERRATERQAKRRTGQKQPPLTTINYTRAVRRGPTGKGDN